MPKTSQTVRTRATWTDEDGKEQIVTILRPGRTETQIRTHFGFTRIVPTKELGDVPEGIEAELRFEGEAT